MSLINPVELHERRMLQPAGCCCQQPAPVKDWRGAKPPKTAKMWTKAAAWNAINSRTLIQMYDPADDVREFADHRKRWRRRVVYLIVLAVLGLMATWAIWTGR